MMPSPPISTLFPYTTLFRSAALARLQEIAGKRPVDDDTLQRVTSSTGRFPAIDRKSTRLNSSHGSISYAGFGLKKKINVIAEYGGPRRCTTPGVLRTDARAP